MAYNRKMRKFEGTCYIPGEQLAMMAKYYRGANLNLNLTLFEEDFATMQETLDQACWCSKLDELDRKKMSHMKGNEWRIQHEHCLEEAQQGSGKNPKVYPALPQSSRAAEGKVERGTSAVSLYDRERGMVRGGRYQRDDYSEPRNRRDDYYDRRNRRDEYNDPQNRKGYYSDPRNAREYYDISYRRDDYSGPPIHHTEVLPNEKRTGRNMGPDKRYDMESEAAMSSMPEAPGDIRCAVCNVETCLVCKNHLYSSICQCKCAVANAGLCNKCSQEPCEEEEQVPQETGGNKFDMPSMMLTMMMSSMFKQSQAPESVCCCKPSRGHSECSSTDSSDGKVHKVYLYDCEDPKNNKKSKRRNKKASSDSSSACDCCKCSRKPKKNSGQKGEGPKARSEDTSESDAGQKSQPTKGKGSKDSNRKSKGGDSNSDTDVKPKGSKDSTRKSTAESRKSNKSSKEDDAKSVKSENMKTTKMKNEKTTTARAKKGKTRQSKAQGSIDSKNVQFSNTEKMSPIKSQELSSSESDVPKRSPSPRKLPPSLDNGIQISDLLDTQQNVPDYELSNHTKKDGDADGVGEESSTTFNLRQFIVCLPKIQSNLQSLIYKLNQMDFVNNQLQYPQTDPSTANDQLPIGEMHARHDVPLLSSPQNPLHHTSGLLYNEHPQLHNPYQKQVSERSIGYSPGNLPVQNLPPTISLGSSKDEPKVQKHLNPTTRYHSTVNFPNFGESPESLRITAGDTKHVPRVNAIIEESAKRPSNFKFSPTVGGVQQKRNITGNSGNQWSFSERNPIANSPTLTFPNIDQSLPQKYFECEPTTSQVYCKKQPGKILHYQKLDEDSVNGVQPLSNLFPLGGSHNIEIIELPETKSYNPGSNLSSKPTQMTHKAGAAAVTSSQCDGETIFQSYKRETSADSSDQDLTDYASFTDEKHFQLSPATSNQQATYQRKNQIKDTINITKSSVHSKISQKQVNQNHSIISKSSRNNRPVHKTRSILKAPKGVTFKAKQRNPLSLEKLVQGCALKGYGWSQGAGIKNNVIKAEKADPGGMPKTKLLDQAIGPGKFRRSKSDSSLEPLDVNPLKKIKIVSPVRPKTPNRTSAKKKTRTVTAISTGKDHTVTPLENKRSTSPIKEKARYTMVKNENSLQPNGKESLILGKFGLRNMASDQTMESDSILKMSDAYFRQELDSQSYIVSSVEVKTINDHRSPSDILKVVQGIASSSFMNVTNVSSSPHQTVPLSSDGFDIIPLLPLSSTTPIDGTESKSENQSGAVIKKHVSFDNEVNPNTPAFLRKSRVQVEQLKRAHETIRSMIKNVNDVIAHIDSDSKIGIKSKARSEDRERQSYFVHLGDDELKRQSHNKPEARRNEAERFERHPKPGSSPKPVCSSDIQNKDVQEMFLSVNRVINSVMTPSEQSNATQDAQWSSENTTPSRAHRGFFILDSESSSTAFTESLRRSLENDRSRSFPLAAQQVPSTRRGTSISPRDTRTARPLKRRSWFPPPKK